MSEKKAIFLIDILKNIIGVYFDTFFVFYFFKIANYEVLPLAKYYVSLYFFIGIGFFSIRRAMKKNIKVPYFRIGISLQALYIALIMLLKDNIIHYIVFVGILKGVADGFYHFPKNLLNSEKITNQDRQKFNGLVNTVNKVMAIIIPLILGVLLTYFSYVSLGKIFFCFFLVMFLLAFRIEDENYSEQSFEFKKFFALVRKNKNIRLSLLIPFLSGFSYSSGVMGTIITLAKINQFKTNLNLGFVDSLCAALSLFACLWFTIRLKPNSFAKIMNITGIFSFVILILMAFSPCSWVLVCYLIIRNTCILTINLITDQVTVNLSNCDELKTKYKPEYYCVRDILFSLSRCLGYLLLLLISFLFDFRAINYLLLLPACALLLESIIVGKLSKKI